MPKAVNLLLLCLVVPVFGCTTFTKTESGRAAEPPIEYDANRSPDRVSPGDDSSAKEESEEEDKEERTDPENQSE